MILTLVRIKDNFSPYGGQKYGKSPVGEVGFLLDGFGSLSTHLMSSKGEVAVETFKQDGGLGATYYHVPANCIEIVQDRDWYSAFEKYYDKHPYIEINCEFMVNDPMFGVWLHVGKPTGGWMNYKHRLLGSEDVKNPNDLIHYWETVANRFGGTLLMVDPYVQALCLDYDQGETTKFPNYHKMWAENVQRAMNARANEQHQDDV